MSLDGQVAGVLGAMKDLGLRSAEAAGVEEFRASFQGASAMQLPPQDVAQVHDIVIPGASGGLAARAYIPDGEMLPLIVYFHGGGWVGGGLSVVDEPCRALANEAGAIVIAATYRLAPEHPFPAAADDAYATVRWVAQNAKRFGADGARIFVAGDSAGGNLAASAALVARDRGAPRLAGTILIYPVVEADGDYASARAYAEGYFLHTAATTWFWDQYLGDISDRKNPLACPANGQAEDLPPTLILTAEYDPTRDQAEAYGAKLARAGVDVAVKRLDGLIHGAFFMSGAIPRAAEFRHAIVDFVHRTGGGEAD